MRVLLTGANGFIGSHLKPRLAESGLQVTGLESPEFDLQDPISITDAVSRHPCDTVIHLAAMSHVGDCKNNPGLARSINVEGTRCLLESVAARNPNCHFIFASSAQVYKGPQGQEITEGVIFDENREILPQNFYGQTKWDAELPIRAFAESGRVRATILRLFNHTHKTQAPSFFLPDVYRKLQIARETGSQPKIPVGNIQISRDIGSIHDLVNAFMAIMNPSEDRLRIFNICSGQKRKLSSLISLLAERLEVRAEFVVDSARVRAGEPMAIQGSHARLTEATGWKPTVVTDDDLIRDFLS